MNIDDSQFIQNYLFFMRAYALCYSVVFTNTVVLIQSIDNLILILNAIFSILNFVVILSFLWFFSYKMYSKKILPFTLALSIIIPLIIANFIVQIFIIMNSLTTYFLSFGFIIMALFFSYIQLKSLFVFYFTESYSKVTVLPLNFVCSICIDEQYTSDIVKLNSCEHLFHKSCIRNWILVKSNCPLCRTDV